MSKYLDFSFNVPPPSNYRFTIDFWGWIHNTQNLKDNSGNLSAISIILRNFGTITLAQSGTSTSLDIFCMPLEYLYTLNNSITTLISYNNVVITNNYFNTKDTKSAISSTWFINRCAISIHHQQMYINSATPVTIPIPQIFSDQTNFTNYLIKFFKTSDKTEFRIQGISNLNTNFILRNINIFSEYLPSTLSYKYS